MFIIVTCPACRTIAKVPDTAAGKKGRCRGCGKAVSVPLPHPPAIACTVCGTEVARGHRDANKNPICPTCWEFKQQRERQQQSLAVDGNPLDDPAIVFAAMESLERSTSTSDPARAQPTELLTCEACDGRFTYPHVRNDRGRVICHDCFKRQNSRAAKASGAVPDEIQEILAVNPWLLLAVVTGIFLIGIPLQVCVMIRLLKAVGTEMKWPWIAGAALPWVGLLVLWVFANKAQRVIDENMPARRPLTSTEEIAYGRAVQLGRIGTGLMFLNGIVSFGVFGQWTVGGIIGILGVAIIATAYLRRFPYDRKISNAGFAKLWFAESKAMSEYQKKLRAM